MTTTAATLPDRSAEAALFAKIAEVMADVGRVEKRGRNDFHKYDYVTEADLVEAVRSKLSDRHVALVPSVQSIGERPYKTDRGKESVVTTVMVAFTFLDGDTGAMFRAEWAGQGDDPADKGLYKAYTGAVKYFLMKTFLIPTGDDPEGDKRTDERAQGRTNGNGRPTAAEPQATEKAASAKQRGLINARAAEKALTRVALLNVVRATAGQEPVTHDDEDRAGQVLNRTLDRLPARLVDPILETIGAIEDPTP